jgi:hemerythrin-like metal-binding domain
MQALFIVWSKKYDTGITILDEQHRGLVSLINSFYYHRADASADIERVLVPTAEMFKAYAKINFYTIEKLLAQVSYEELDKCHEEHKMILRGITLADSKYRAARDVNGMLEFLKKYWLAYVRKGSMKYIDFLKEHFPEEKK